MTDHRARIAALPDWLRATWEPMLRRLPQGASNGASLLSKARNRETRAVVAGAQKLKTAKPREIWTSELDARLIALHAARVPMAEIAVRMNMTLPAVKMRVQKLRALGQIDASRFKPLGRNAWTPDEERRLAEHIGKPVTKAVAATFGRSPTAVRRKLERMKEAQK